ncbi:MAG TPA: hypothetical protein VEG37_04150 [Burkholderiales bacterium]|nr:hypothetical protein [Burkholderiales bacterium]
MSRTFAYALAALFLSAFSSRCVAAPEEIQVYIDDITEPGHFGSDIHNNYVVSGDTAPAYSGNIPPNGVYRLTPEIYYGVNKNLELGLYTLSSYGPNDRASYDGEKVRIKYIADHDEAMGPFWGANFEFGWISHQFAEQPWNAELKGIYGFRKGLWLFAINPNLDWGFSGSTSSPVALSIDTKLSYKVWADYALGFEAYNDLGTLNDLGHLSQQSEMLYAVVDAELKYFDLNFGVGWGLTPASDNLVLKMIVGMRY